MKLTLLMYYGTGRHQTCDSMMLRNLCICCVRRLQSMWNSKWVSGGITNRTSFRIYFYITIIIQGMIQLSGTRAAALKISCSNYSKNTITHINCSIILMDIVYEEVPLHLPNNLRKWDQIQWPSYTTTFPDCSTRLLFGDLSQIIPIKGK